MIWPQILDERETSLSPSYHRRLAPGEVLIFATPSCITKKRDTRLCCISIGTPIFWLEIMVIIHLYPFQRAEIELCRIVDFLFLKIITFSLGLCKLRIKLRNPNLRWLSTHQDFFFNLNQCLFKRFQIEKSLTLSCTVVLPCI